MASLISDQTIGIVAGIFTATSLLPQLIKIIKDKKAEDISIPMLLILLTGLSLWVWYGFKKDDWPIIVTNIYSLALNIGVIILSVKYKKTGGA
jgi:MtN3 and saliva related transmembrane protein